MSGNTGDKDFEIGFLLPGALNHVIFNPALPDGMEITIGDPPVVIALKGEFEPLKYSARCRLRCSKDQFEFVKGLILRKYIPIEGAPIKLPHQARGNEVIAADGKHRARGAT